MLNITIPVGLFQLTSSVCNKDYQDHLFQLRNINRLLDKIGIEKVLSQIIYFKSILPQEIETT